MKSFKEWLNSIEENHVADELKRAADIIDGLPELYKNNPTTNKPYTPDQVLSQVVKDPKYNQVLQGLKKHKIPFTLDKNLFKNKIVDKQNQERSAAPKVPTAGVTR